MKDNNHITDEMLVRFIAGEASLQERLSVQEWISVSKENKNRLDELTLIWKESGKLGLTTSVSAEEAWERFTERIAKTKHRRRGEVRSFQWIKAAAILLLLAGGGWFSWVSLQPKVDSENVVATMPTPAGSDVEPAQPADAINNTVPGAPETEVENKKGPELATTLKKREPVTAGRKAGGYELHKNTRTKDFICNATPCPLEICIVQTILCSNGKPASVATCNLLQPDQAGQLHYKAIDKALGDCHATVSEIRIKRVTTGETIVLNNNSKPSTAEELFNYLTGKSTAEGDILAGIFETDCDNSCSENKLKVGNNFGHLILE